ncbi:MAG: hypothetical protein KDK78_08255 [Chlamydiia bacterium]|nr:hypothetical protein [Chlamydiia bacterium]
MFRIPQLIHWEDLTQSKAVDACCQASGLAAIHALAAAILKRYALPCSSLVLGIGLGAGTGYLVATAGRRVSCLNPVLRGCTKINSVLTPKWRCLLVVAIGIAGLALPLFALGFGFALGFLTGLSLETTQYKKLVLM